MSEIMKDMECETIEYPIDIKTYEQLLDELSELLYIELSTNSFDPEVTVSGKERIGTK